MLLEIYYATLAVVSVGVLIFALRPIARVRTSSRSGPASDPARIRGLHYSDHSVGSGLAFSAGAQTGQRHSSDR